MSGQPCEFDHLLLAYHKIASVVTSMTSQSKVRVPVEAKTCLEAWGKCVILLIRYVFSVFFCCNIRT